MIKQRIWVHGNAAVLQFPGGHGSEFFEGARMAQVFLQSQIDDSRVQIPWTDVVGFHTGSGVTYRGQGNGEDSNSFHFSIPTPSMIWNLGNGDDRPFPRTPRPVKLGAVFVLYRSDPGVDLIGVRVSDGARLLKQFRVVPPGTERDSVEPRADCPGTSRHDLDGTNPIASETLIECATQFTLTDRPGIFWGIGIQAVVGFRSHGNITFTAAGAELLIPELRPAPGVTDLPISTDLSNIPLDDLHVRYKP